MSATPEPGARIVGTKSVPERELGDVVSYDRFFKRKA